MKTLTGITPSNILQIGNLFGALIPAVELQKEHELYMMIADYHAITVPQNPETLNQNILMVAAAYIAAGINPTKTVLFQQSQISAHTELAWVMQTQTHMGEARRMTQFKDKSGDRADGVSVGLFTYPTLMAADILLYDIEGVPVGHDQKQHLELTRDIAQRFNNAFGETFVVPKPMIKKEGAKIKSLTEPEKKMSKSSPSAKSYISIMDNREIVHKKIRSAVTDSERLITFDENREGLHNLLTIFSLCAEKSGEELAHEYAERGMKELKDDLATALSNYLDPIQTRINELLTDKEELKRIIANGSVAAEKVAMAKMKEVKKAIGVVL